jgi:hypothetical protein
MDKYCRHGHEYTPENSYVHNGVVQCKECRRVNRNKSYRKYHPPVSPEIRWPKHEYCNRGHLFTDETRILKKDGGSTCRICNNEKQKEWAHQHPEYMYKTRIESQMWFRYGIRSLEERDVILASQGNACAICGRMDCHWGKGFTNVWHIDHDPTKPGTHRGILCGFCNTSLGRLEKNIISVNDYLSKHQQKNNESRYDDALRKKDYEVRTVPLTICQEKVVKYHYAKSGSNTATFRHGLFLKTEPNKCLGIAWWIPPTKSAALANYPDNWKAVLVLSRLVIDPDIPKNAASFLIMQSVKLIKQDPRWECLLTYADEWQKHSGAIYKATNWIYCGKTIPEATWLDKDGHMVARKAGPHTRTKDEMLALGCTMIGRYSRHRFKMVLPKHKGNSPNGTLNSKDHGYNGMGETI